MRLSRVIDFIYYDLNTCDDFTKLYVTIEYQINAYQYDYVLKLDHKIDVTPATAVFVIKKLLKLKAFI